MAGEKVDKILFRTMIMASNPKVTEAQINSLWNNYQATGTLPKEFAGLLPSNDKKPTSKSSVFGVNTASNGATSFNFDLTAPLSTQPAKKAPQHTQTQAETPKSIAGNLFNLADEYSGAVSQKSFQTELSKINKNNVLDVLNAYEKKSPNESLIEMICNEKGSSSAERQAAISKVFGEVAKKAQETGVDTTPFQIEFNKESNIQFKKIGFTDAAKMDTILNAVVQATKNKATLTPQERKSISSTSSVELEKQATEILQNRAQSAQSSFDNQMKEDGWAGDVADFTSGLWGSKNRAKTVRTDIATFNKQVQQLKTAETKGSNAYKAKFYETFGVEYDAQNIAAYKKKEQQNQTAMAVSGIEANFNSTANKLLKNPKLQEETYTTTAPTSAGAITTTSVSATKEQVYNRELNHFAEFIGKGDVKNGKAQIEAYMKSKGLDLNKSTLDQKYVVMHERAVSYSKELHLNTMKVTENKGMTAFSKEYDASYNVAFGVKNDIAKRVTEYNNSQQAGAAIVKNGAILAGSLAAGALTGGSALAFFPALMATGATTAAVTAGVEFLDRLTSGHVTQGFKKGGLTGAFKGAKEALPKEKIEEILKSAGVNGATAIAGGLASAGVEVGAQSINIGKGLKTAAFVATDIAVGAGAEYVQTGTVTIEGIAFSAVLSSAGQIVALKKLGKVEETNTKNKSVVYKENDTFRGENYESYTKNGKTTYIKVDGKGVKTTHLVDNATNLEIKKTVSKKEVEDFTTEDGNRVRTEKSNREITQIKDAIYKGETVKEPSKITIKNETERSQKADGTLRKDTQIEKQSTNDIIFSDYERALPKTDTTESFVFKDGKFSKSSKYVNNENVEYLTTRRMVRGEEILKTNFVKQKVEPVEVVAHDEVTLPVADKAENTANPFAQKAVVQVEAQKIEASKTGAIKAKVQKESFNAIGETEIMEELKKSGFQAHSDGKFSKLLSEKERLNLEATCSEPIASLIKSNTEQPLSLSDISNIKKLLNLSNGKYIQLFKENPKDFVYFYRTIERSGYLQKFGETLMPEHLDLLMNTVKSKCPPAAQDAFCQYKGSSSDKVNEALTAQKSNKKPLDQSVQKMVDKMSSYIDTQVIKEPTTVYRSEKYEVLKSIKLENGNTLGVAMKEAAKRASKGDFGLVNKIINEVKKNDYIATQERFMSTSMTEDVKINHDIKWEIELKPGSKGVALEAINVGGLAVGEHELLLQKDSQLHIADIDYKDGAWHLKGVVQTTKVDPKRFGLNLSGEEKLDIENNVQRLYNSTKELAPEVVVPFKKDFEEIEGVTTQNRVKDQDASHEKSYRRYQKAQKRVAELEGSLKTETKPEEITKIKNEIAEKKQFMKDLGGKYSVLAESLGDSLGLRIIFSKPTAKNIEAAVKKIIDGINKGDYVITELENYAVGKDGFYFNQNQVDRIAEACKAKGIEMKYTEGFKDSGYTTTQLNVVHKNGVRSELQIRGSEVHATSESEHVLYDIREGKDIAKGNKEIEDILAPVYDAVKQLDANETLKKKYEGYLKNYYQYKRDLELGKQSTAPKLSSEIPKELDMDNIIRLNALVHAQK